MKNPLPPMGTARHPNLPKGRVIGAHRARESLSPIPVPPDQPQH